MVTFKDFVRMCKSNIDGEACTYTCPFFNYNSCIYYITHCTEEAEATIDKWCAEHPIKTYKDDFFEKFPRAQKTEANTPRCCVDTIYGTNFPCESCKDCWNREYKMN